MKYINIIHSNSKIVQDRSLGTKRSQFNSKNIVSLDCYIHLFAFANAFWHQLASVVINMIKMYLIVLFQVKKKHYPYHLKRKKR